jgi:hypothetical protein
MMEGCWCCCLVPLALMMVVLLAVGSLVLMVLV